MLCVDECVARFIEAVVFQLVMLLWSYFSVVFTDPGGVPPNWKPVVDEENGEADLLADSEFIQLPGEPTNLGVRYCRKCNQLKPPRCHHCSVCKHCSFFSFILLELLYPHLCLKKLSYSFLHRWEMYTETFISQV